MRLLVYGMGNQGSLLAHSLVNGNSDVTVLARGKRAESIEKNGNIIRHYLQRKTTKDKLKVIHTLEENDIYDIIFVTMKYTDFPAVLPILAKNKSENIILIGNNATPAEMEHNLQINSVNAKNIVFGFQISGGRREENQTIALRINAGQMVLGSLKGDVPFKNLLNQAFKSTKYKLTYEENIVDWLKSHIISILPINLASFINDYEFKAIGKNNRLIKEIVQAMDEGYDMLKNLGYKIIPAKQAKLVKKYKFLNFLFYKIYHFSPIANQSASSFAEIKGLYDELYKIKDHSAIHTPALDKLVRIADKKFLLETGDSSNLDGQVTLN